MSTISVRLPDSLHSMAKTLASQDNASMNQFIAANFQAALAAVSAREPEDFDRL